MENIEEVIGEAVFDMAHYANNFEINSDKLKIDLDNYKDYFINRL